MEYATIVSIFPFDTEEKKPGLANGNFFISGAKEDDFVVYHVRDSFFTMRIPATDNHVNVPIYARVLAKSIVDDFAGSHIASDTEARPGMFWVPGKLDKLQVLSQYKDKLEAAKISQRGWFLNLVKLADDDWNQYHQQGLISEQQRYAARALKYDAPWLVKYDNVSGTKDCPVCYTKIDQRAAKCPQCLAILDQAIVDRYSIPNTPQIPDNIEKLVEEVTKKGK